jgi:pyridoxal phosphate enzyme (YggS family)
LNSLAERLAGVRQRISTAATEAGRDAAEIQLIVVTKNHSAATVLRLFELGVRDFGENRDQEAAPKAKALAELLSRETGAENPRWHFVGQLQTNKVRSVIGYAAVLHSLDRLSLVQELDKQLDRFGANLDCFIQLNLTENPDRGGVRPEDLAEFARVVSSAQRIKLLGLMAVADPRNAAKSDFSRVLLARDELLSVAPEANQLSIGMSGDFEEAIRCGATHLRIGSAITATADATT